MLIKKGILILLLFVFGYTVIGQDYTIKNYRGELNIAISDAHERRFTKAVAELNAAVDLENDAIGIIESMEQQDTIRVNSIKYRSAIKDLHRASEMYLEAHAKLYEIFSENCDLFRTKMKKMNHYASGLKKAKFYEIKGKQHLERAGNIHDIVIIADKPGWIQYKMSESIEYQKLAVRDKGRALQIMQDFPVEYNYNWENDVTQEEVDALLGDKAVKRPPEDLFVQKMEEVVDTLPEPVKIKEEDLVVFRVQIAAHHYRMEEQYLRNIYSGDKEIIEIKEGVWFKYQIGHFYNFKEANALLKKCGVRNAFIVAYHGKKKKTIKQALQIIRLMQ